MSVHKYLLSGPSLNAATRAAVDRLSVSLHDRLAGNSGGSLDSVRHELTLSLTGAVYGPETRTMIRKSRQAGGMFSLWQIRDLD
jgi:hypothetical protein